MAAGMKNAEIGAALGIAPVKVKTHVNNVFATTGVTDRGQAMAFAYQHGTAAVSGRGSTR